MVLSRPRGSVKPTWLGLGLWFGLVSLLACKDEPQPRAAFEATPVRTLAAGELGEAGEVEGFAVAVVREGEGDPAERGDFVRVHYVALLPDHSELDSSHADDPLLFRLGDDDTVIEGVHAGVLGMRLHELRTITIPPELGYRNRKGVGVPADATLTFLVELVEIKPR
ncbi:FKBP-type peptidyl-prolyl cis-trans isomerase [Nannocystaceae bacterium ST9]